MCVNSDNKLSKICDVCCSNDCKFSRNTGHNSYWYCPHCGASVGVHDDNPSRPMGVMAQRTTRRYRKIAHEAFDRLWQDGHMSRNAAYSWLARQLGVERANISSLTLDQLKSVVVVCSKYLELYPLNLQKRKTKKAMRKKRVKGDAYYINLRKG